MATTYRFIEDPAIPSSVRQWFKALPVPPEETETERVIVLYFCALGPLTYTASGEVDPKLSPVATLYLPRHLRGALWSVGEVHFLAAALKEKFPELHEINTAFAKWLRQFGVVFSNKPAGPSDWNHYLEGSVKNYDPPVFGLPSGYQAIQNGQYFVSNGESNSVVDKARAAATSCACGSLRCFGALASTHFHVMQLEDFTEGWVPVHVGLEGSSLFIGGINPWLHASNWRSVQQEHIVVPHPAHRHERHRAWIYEVTANGKVTRFAATELSNGVWGFYVPNRGAA